MQAARRHIDHARGTVMTDVRARQAELLAGLDGEPVRLPQAGAPARYVHGVAEHERRRTHEDRGALTDLVARVSPLFLFFGHCLKVSEVVTKSANSGTIEAQSGLINRFAQ